MVNVILSAAFEVAKCLVAPFVDPCVAPVRRRCDYLTSYDDYVGQLEQQAKKLDNERQTKQRLITEAKKYGKKIYDNVEKWMKEAENDSQEARRVLDDNETAIKTCFYGWLPNPKARYRLGRDARTIAERIQKLLDRIPSGNVCDDDAAPGLVDGTPDVNSSVSDGGHTITDSRASLFQGIMKALDNEKLKVIGVYGPGGVGKSTLLEEVEKKLRKEGRPFKMIAKSTVSQNPDVKKIQDDIAYAFGINLKDEPSQVGRRALLSKILKDDPKEKEEVPKEEKEKGKEVPKEEKEKEKEKEEAPKEKKEKKEEVPKEKEKFLIILDDLWDALDLKEVGISLGDESNKCQLLLTSRDKIVLEQRMDAHPTFHLKGLSDVEAFRLFEETYGDKLKDDEGLKAKAAQVVAKLAGLPLLIKSVASTLKCGDESTWDTALIKIEDPNIKSIVEWSYGRLMSAETESLFLLCGFVGGSIPVELLLGLGMGLGLFEGFDMTIRSSRSKLNEMLRRLRSICLLLDDGDDKENVTIHDLYSEAVISTPLTGQNSLRPHRNAGSWPKKKLEKCWVCLVNVGSDRLAELRLQRSPDSEIFMLSKQHDERDCHGLDFPSMKELRVLYLRSINFTSFHSSVEILENLQSLYLDNCDVVDVVDIAILGKLKALQILSFAGSSISSLPKEIGKLTKLKLLNLTNCWMLEKIEPCVLQGLTNLEELYMRKSFDKWMGSGEDDEDEISLESCNAKLADLNSSTNLTTLEISIPNPNVLLEGGDLPLGNLIGFWINIGNADEGEIEGLTTMMHADESKIEGLRTMILKLEECDGILSKEWVQKTLLKTQCLLLYGLRESKKSAHELCSRGFSQLKHLDIQNCSSIKHIVSSYNGAFPLLESLFLENLINLEKICDGLECFGKLKAIRVRECDQLKFLWCLSQMHSFAQLKEIEVHSCASMRAVAIDDVGKDIVVADNKVELPNLRRLELAKLPKMTSFCIEAGITSHGAPIQVCFPRLESLVMEGLLDLENILYGQPPLEYRSLKSIEIRESKSTSTILKSDWILKLPNLESLEIGSSPSAEVVFDLEEPKVTGHVEILSRLATLRLDELPNVRLMCKENAQLQRISVFRNLKELEVINIGLTFLFSISMAKCLREITKIVVGHCDEMEALVVDEDGRDEGTNDITKFPLLKQLDIGACPKLKFFLYPPGKKEAVATTSCSQDTYSDSFFDQKVSLPNLEELSFWSVGSFKNVWPRELPKRSLDNLNEIYVSNCPELLNIFLSTHLGRLHNLKIVRIEDCHSLESVFEYGSSDSNTEQTRILLLDLETIHIEGCPSLESVFDCGSLTKHKTLSLPKLESLTVDSSRALRHMVKSNSQTSLGFPSLEEVEVNDCSELRYLFPYGTATTLETLKRLSIEDCGQMKEVVAKEEGGRSEAGALSFPSLTNLDILGCSQFEAFVSNPTSVERPSGEMAKEIDELRQPFFNEMVNLPSLEELRFRSVGSIKSIWPRELPQRSFDKLAEIRVSECSELLNVFLSSHLGRLHNLKIVRIEDCHSLESVFEYGSSDSNTEQTRILLPDLETIHIKGCPSLESVFDCGSLTEHKILSLPKLESLTMDSSSALRHVVKSNSQTFLGFPSLEEVEVNDCSGLRYLFPYGTATTLEKLSSLQITDCERMKEVVAKEEGDPSKASLLSFPSLTSLIISQCPSFVAFIPNPTSVERPLVKMAKENDESRQPFFNEMVTFPILIMVEIRGVQVKELWNNQIHDDSFGKLESLQLVNCDNLRCIAPSHVWKKLQSCLTMLEVKSCHSIEIIYESDATVADTSQLRSLILNDLENLRHIWWHDNLPHINVPFPNLRDIEVRRCPRLRMLFGTFTASFLGQIKWLEVESCDDMELIADHGECEEATCTTITFSELVALKLKELPKFRSYLPEKYHVEFPPLRALIRVGCGKEPDQSDGSDLVGWENDRAAERNQAMNDRILSSEDGSEDVDILPVEQHFRIER